MSKDQRFLEERLRALQVQKTREQIQLWILFLKGLFK